MTVRRLRSARAVAWSPYIIPRSLLCAYWDAALANSITESGGAVSSWRDVIAGVDTAQATEADRPNLVDGWIYGDGLSKCLRVTPVPTAIPTGSNSAWDWYVVDQNVPASNTSALPVLGGWGANTGGTQRTVTRVVVDGVNRARLNSGSIAGNLVTNLNVDFTGRHVVCAKVSSTHIDIAVDGVGATPVAMSQAIGTTSYVSHFSRPSNTPGAWFAGGIAARLITRELPASLEAAVLAYLMGRATG
jgi:hypothetical protein